MTKNGNGKINPTENAREIELKFALTAQIAQDLAADFPWPTGPERVDGLQATYFDTPDQILRQNGLSLRIRKEGEALIQTIKSSANAGTAFAERGEWSCKMRGQKPVLSGMAAKVLARIPESLRPDDSIGKAFTVDVIRHRREVVFEKSRIEIALDFGSILAGRRREAFHELELELLEGERDDLFSFALNLCSRVPLRLHMQTKSERGFALLSGASEPVKADKIVLDPAKPVQEAFQRIARGCLFHLSANEAVFWKTKAPETIHQIRVAIRRLRAAMRLFRTFVRDENQGPLKAELRLIAGELGEARDLDVFIAHMLEDAPQTQDTDFLALRQEYEERRARSYDNAAALLASPRFSHAILTLAQWIECGDWLKAGPDKTPALPKFAARQLTRCWKQVRRQIANHKKLDEEARHGWRIGVKKLRYACEFFAPLFMGPEADDGPRRALRHLASLQDHLGALNDLAVARGRNPLSKAAAERYRKRAGQREAWLSQIDTDCAALQDLMPFWKKR